MKKKEKRSEYIYVVLVKALTGLGKFARITSKYDYTHIAICLDEQMDKFYTFSRKKHYSPFDCGFMIETLDCYAFGKHKQVKLKIFKIPISIENKNKIKKYIKSISEDKEYLFNFYSMITMSIFHGFKIYKSHNCMTFVSKIIEMSKSVTMQKLYYKYNIKELDILLSDFLYKEEIFKKTKTVTKDYMKHVSLLKNVWLFLNINVRLIYRLIFKRKDVYE